MNTWSSKTWLEVNLHVNLWVLAESEEPRFTYPSVFIQLYRYIFHKIISNTMQRQRLFFLWLTNFYTGFILHALDKQESLSPDMKIAILLNDWNFNTRFKYSSTQQTLRGITQNIHLFFLKHICCRGRSVLPSSITLSYHIFKCPSTWDHRQDMFLVRHNHI